MREANKIHCLKILIEVELYKTLNEIAHDEFMSRNEKREEQQSEIIKFINRLPPLYRNIENRDEIIAITLHRMGVQTEWGSKKLQEIAMNKRMQEINAQRGIKPTNSQGIEK